MEYQFPEHLVHVLGDHIAADGGGQFAVLTAHGLLAAPQVGDINAFPPYQGAAGTFNRQLVVRILGHGFHRCKTSFCIIV